MGCEVMLILKMVLLVLCSVLAAVPLGNMIFRLAGIKNESVASMYVAGIISSMAMYEVVYLFLVFRYESLSKTTFIWGAVMLLFIVAGIVTGIAYGKKNKNLHDGFKGYFTDIRVHHVIAVCVCVAYIIFTLVYQREYTDDSLFVGMASTAYSTDTLIRFSPFTGRQIELSYVAKYILSGYHAYMASVSAIFGMQPVVMMHNVLPVIIIAMHYIVCYGLASVILKDKKSADYAIIFLTIIDLFSMYNRFELTTSAWLFTGPWYGKSIIGNVIIPVLWYYLIRIMDEDGNAKSTKRMWGLVAVVHTAAALISTYGSIASATVTLCITVYYMIKNRRLSYALGFVISSVPSIALMSFMLYMQYMGVKW
jgi:hypothetical protein